MTTLDTKEKILRTAHELFANKGIAATSIRDIANAAEVNTAAINYHFKSKENLYKKIMKFCHEDQMALVQKISDSSKDFEELCLNFFKDSYKNSDRIKTLFKAFIQDTSGFTLEEKDLHIDKTMGPPGTEILAKRLKEEVSSDVSQEDIFLYCKTICITIFMYVLALRSPFAAVKGFTVSKKERELKRLIDVFKKQCINKPS